MGDTRYFAIHAKKRGRIALVKTEKAMKEIISAVNSHDELLSIVKDMRNAKAEVFSISPEGRAYLARMDAAIANASK